MSTATQNISIRIAVLDGDKVRRELTLTGEAGQRALAKIKESTAPTSTALTAINAVSEQARSGLENLANSAGSVGNTLASLGPVGLAAAAALGAVTFATVQGVAAFKESEQSSNRLATALKATEFAAGVTANQIADLATELQKNTLFSDEQAQDAASNLIYFGNITGETLQRAIRLSLDFAQAFGTDVSTAAQQVGKALQDPEQGMGRLQNKVGDLSTAQKELIKQLMEANDVAGAQNIVLDKLAHTIGGQAEGQNQGLTGATNALSDEWGDLLEEIGRTASESTIAIGSINLLAGAIQQLRQVIAPTREEELKSLQGQISEYQNSLSGRVHAYLGFDAPYISTAKQRVKELNEELSQEQLKAEQEKQDALRKSRDAAAERDKSALLAIEQDFRKKFKETTQTDRERAIEEATTAKKRIDALFKDDRNSEAAQKARAAVDASLNAKLAKLNEMDKAHKAAVHPIRQLTDANQKLVESLEKRLRVESMSDPKKRFVQGELDKLSANAANTYRQRVKELASAIYDKQKAEQDAKEASSAHKHAIAEINSELLQTKPSYDLAKQALDDWKDKLIENLGGATEANQEYIDKIEQIYAVKIKQIYDKSLLDSTKWEDGASRALKRYADEATNAAKNAETLFSSVSSKVEDSLVDMVSSGELSFKKLGDLVQSIQQDILRVFIREQITGPIANSLSSSIQSSGGDIFGSMFSSIFHDGGVVGTSMVARRAVPAHTFVGAPRFHNGLMPDEFPAILQKGETVLPKNTKMGGHNITFNISTPNAQSFMDSQGQIMSKLAAQMGRHKARNG